MRNDWQGVPAPWMAFRMRAVAAGAMCGLALLLSGSSMLAQGPSQGDDKYIWLENVSSPKSMDWVNAENARRMKVFEADPHFKEFDEEAVKLGSNPNRLPMPALRGDEVYNSWRDKGHARGLLRKTSVAD